MVAQYFINEIDCDLFYYSVVQSQGLIHQHFNFSE